jgi:hypothetical protein
MLLVFCNLLDDLRVDGLDHHERPGAVVRCEQRACIGGSVLTAQQTHRPTPEEQEKN